MSALNERVSGLLAHMHEDLPTLATFQGVEGYDDRLPDLSADAYRRRDRDDAAWEARFAELDDGLSPAERIDRDLALSHLRGRRILSDWMAWRREPEHYVGAGLMGVFSLYLRRLHPEPELVRFAVARLGAVAQVLSDARANLDADLASPVMVERAIRQCRSAIPYLRQLVPAEVADAALRSELGTAADRAAGEYESFLAWLSTFAETCHGEWAIGESRYSALLQERELLGDDAASLRARGNAAYDELEREIRALARELGGTDDWRSVLHDLARDRPATEDDMLAAYARCTAEARQFLVDHDLVSLPEGEMCEVVPSPPFQRPLLAVASYIRPPAFRESLTGRFNVPFAPDGASAEEIEGRLTDNSYPSMPTITVHETYPGHHWHYARLQAACDRPLRRVLTTPYFSEGWALYAERMMREQGYFRNAAHEVHHVEARLFRAARIVIDTSLHCGEMTFDEAVAGLQEKTKLTEPVARAEVARYCAAPTQAASYLTGALEVERIRDDWFAADRGDLRQFHDTLCGAGALPLALAERAVLA